MAATTSLILSESVDQRQAICRLIQPTGLFDSNVQVATEREALCNLKEHGVAAIFYGADRGDKREFRWLRRREKRKELSDIPIFLFTGEEDEDSRILGLNLGADDCLTLKMSTGEAAARIRRHLHARQNLAELRRVRDELARQTLTDHLTGLGNRRHFFTALEAEVSRLNRNAEPFSLLMLDLDHFKKINDTFGHQVGDQVLKSLADTLRARLRKSDTVCRLGGEEFAVIMPGAKAADARRVAEHIRRKVAVISLQDCPEARVTISIGIRSLVQPEDVKKIILDADQALYRAKFLGRNRVEAFQDKPLKIFGNCSFEPELLRAAGGIA